MDKFDLVLCQSHDGWSLHPPGSTDDDIACGDALYLLSGEGNPTQDDYTKAAAILRHKNVSGVQQHTTAT